MTREAIQGKTILTIVGPVRLWMVASTREQPTTFTMATLFNHAQCAGQYPFSIGKGLEGMDRYAIDNRPPETLKTIHTQDIAGTLVTVSPKGATAPRAWSKPHDEFPAGSGLDSPRYAFDR
jgi:hypothetical protein